MFHAGDVGVHDSEHVRTGPLILNMAQVMLVPLPQPAEERCMSSKSLDCARSAAKEAAKGRKNTHAQIVVQLPLEGVYVQVRPVAVGTV